MRASQNTKRRAGYKECKWEDRKKRFDCKSGSLAGSQNRCCIVIDKLHRRCHYRTDCRHIGRLASTCKSGYRIGSSYLSPYKWRIG